MNTQRELRSFAYGAVAGIVIMFGALFVVSRTAGIRWQPVKVGASDAVPATKPPYPAEACSDYPIASGFTLPARPR